MTIQKTQSRSGHIRLGKLFKDQGYLGPLPIPHNSSPPHPAPRSKVCLATAAKNEWGFQGSGGEHPDLPCPVWIVDT